VIQATVNGGFPMPAATGRKRFVEATHDACSRRTRVSLPAALPALVVRRVVCEHCEELYEARTVVEVRAMPRLPRLSVAGLPASVSSRLPSTGGLSIPAGLGRRWLTLPIAALAVFGVLNLVNGGGDAVPEEAPTAAIEPEPIQAQPQADAKAKGGAKPAPVPNDAQLITEATFSLALPAGWDRVNPAAGATFAAVAPDGSADATLWIQSDPKLDLATFEANSLAQLETLTGSAEVVERKVGPNVESSSIVLAPKDAAAGAPTHEVVLRAAGGNWYYLATTHQASAPADAIAAVDLIQGSFVAHGSKR
jgi:hypothetical protein